MSHRVIRGLLWAEPGDGPGWGTSRARGAKAAGLRYERALGKVLPAGFLAGRWFRFADAAGLGWCQPDYFAVGKSAVLVLECKLSWVAEGHTQISQLYSPVLSRVYGLPVLGVQVCRGLEPGAKNVVGDLRSAIAVAQAGRPAVLHWFEKTPVQLTRKLANA